MDEFPPRTPQLALGWGKLKRSCAHVKIIEALAAKEILASVYTTLHSLVEIGVAIVSFLLFLYISEVLQRLTRKQPRSLARSRAVVS